MKKIFTLLLLPIWAASCCPIALAIVCVLASVSGVALADDGNNEWPTNVANVADWGFGPLGPAEAPEAIEVHSEFGAGIFAQVQDCPNGLCPVPNGTRDWSGDQPTTSGAAYNQRWSVAGGNANVAAHLAAWPHNLTTSELLRIHDAEHDIIGPVSGAEIAAMNGGSSGVYSYSVNYAQSAGIYNAFGQLRGGFGLLGNRVKPLFWRFRPVLRARNGW